MIGQSNIAWLLVFWQSFENHHSCNEHTFNINLIEADLEANDLIDHG